MFTKGQGLTLVVIPVAVLLVVVGCAPSPTPVPASAIVLASAKALNAGDIEKSLAYYADDAVVKLVGLPPGEPDTFTGKEQIRTTFKAWNAIHFQVQIEIVNEDGVTVTSKASTWSDPTRALGVAPLIGNEVDVIKNGKIAGFTWTLTPESAAKMQAAVAAMQAKAAQPTPTAIPLPTPGPATTPFPIDVFVDANGSTLEHRANGTIAYHGVAGNDDAIYKLTGDQIVYTGGGCVIFGGDGVYQWSYDGKALTFKALAPDTCAGRSTALSVSYTKKP